MTFHSEPVPGVHRFAHAHVNAYAVEDAAGDLTLVDAGLPALWSRLGGWLRDSGRSPSRIRGLVLTHAHFDHVGIVRRLQGVGVPVWAHAAEHHLARHPYDYAHERPRSAYPLRHPRALPVLAAMVAAGALTVRGAQQEIHPFHGGQRLDLPGRPVVVASPGHTDGHCALLLPDRGCLLTGDALVTLDPYTGETGPRIVAGAATADSAAALRSLDALAVTGAAVLLPGHGEPWTAGVDAAVDAARAVGPS